FRAARGRRADHRRRRGVPPAQRTQRRRGARVNRGGGAAVASPLALAIGALALVAGVLALARLVAAPGTSGVELGRSPVTSVDPALRARLERGDLDVLVQWFGPSATARPAGYDEVEERVRTAFEALERAAPGR